MNQFLPPQSTAQPIPSEAQQQQFFNPMQLAGGQMAQSAGNPFLQQGMSQGQFNQQPGPLTQQFNQGLAQSTIGNSVSGAAQGAGADVGGALKGLCCWIMVYGNGGFLPWFIKPLRDIAYEEEPLVAQGYKAMAGWLVPSMMFSESVEHLVKCLMIQPLTEHCGYIMSVRGCKARTNYQRFWFGIWRLVGKLTTNSN